MKNHIKTILSLSIFFFLTAILNGQTTKRPFSISGEYLLTKVFSTQSPDAKKSFQVNISGVSAFGVQFECPIKNDIWFGAGYRFNQHWITWASGLSKSSTAVEEAHSLNLNVTLKKSLCRRSKLSRFTLDCGGGFLFSKMQHFLVSDGNATLVDGNGTVIFTASEFFRNEDVNQVEVSASLDVSAKIDYKLYKNVHLYLGYGYTKGFRTLAKGSYRFAGGGIVERGTMTNSGSYEYAVLGARVVFREKNK